MAGASGSLNGGQSSDYQLFELVHREDTYMPSIGQATLRKLHVEFLSHIRLTDYKKPYDTLTVSTQMVHDVDYFFSLMSMITEDKAFSEVVMLSARTGRVQIDSPKWLDQLDQTYLGVWIAGLLEENLWAHYNFANSVNIASSVRNKSEVSNLFETRSETLTSQEDLAEHWQNLGPKSRQ